MVHSARRESGLSPLLSQMSSKPGYGHAFAGNNVNSINRCRKHSNEGGRREEDPVEMLMFEEVLGPHERLAPDGEFGEVALLCGTPSTLI